MNKINNNRINIALVFFLIAGIYGFLLRWQYVQPIIKYPYTDVLQAHSHVTFLGWGFLAIITLVSAAFLGDKYQRNSYLTYSFWIMVLAIVGMLLSFPLQGYSYFSIGFLTLFLLSSYVYLWALLRQLHSQSSLSVKFIKWGIFYYYLSSLGIWALSFIAYKIGRGDLYQNAINFYTHFLYNGFFVLVLFGLFVRYIELQNNTIPKKSILWFFYLTNIAVIPAFAIALLWKNVSNYIVYIGFFAAFIQLVSLYYMWKIYKAIYIQKIITKKTFINLVLQIIFWAYSLKVIIQFLGSFPKITVLAMQYKPYFVIGYIHLFTLGFLSLFLFLFIKLYSKRSALKWGVLLFILGIFATEILIFLQGILLYANMKTVSNYYEILLIASAFMPLGIVLILLNRYFKRQN